MAHDLNSILELIESMPPDRKMYDDHTHVPCNDLRLLAETIRVLQAERDATREAGEVEGAWQALRSRAQQGGHRCLT